MQAIAGPGGAAVADAVGQYDEILACIERLSGPEQLASQIPDA
jgi:hypothetical protein